MAYPSTDFKTLSLTSNIDESHHMSESGKTQARRHGGQRFEVTIEHPPQTKSEFMPTWAFLRSQQGRDQSFTITLPDKSTPLGAIDGSSTPVLNSDRARGSSSIAVDGLVASVTDIFYASDMINFGNHSKAYKIVSRANSEAHDAIAKADSTGVLLKADGSGDKLLMTRANQATITVSPPLVEDVPDGTAVTYGANFTLTVKQKNDIQVYNVEPPNIYAHQIDLVEYI